MADSQNHRIVRFDDMSGAGWTTLGTQGNGVKQFNEPLGIHVDQKGRIYVADSGNSRLVRMDDMSGRLDDCGARVVASNSSTIFSRWPLTRPTEFT